MTLNNILMFLTLTGIYEPSAIQQLPDGRFLVVEDEKKHPFSLVTLAPDGSVSSTALSLGDLQAGDDFRKLDDLEGVALDRSGFVYALTSHSRDRIKGVSFAFSFPKPCHVAHALDAPVIHKLSSGGGKVHHDAEQHPHVPDPDRHL